MAKYICPMHSNVFSDKPGKCHICGMSLVEKGSLSKPESQSYKPLVVIIGLIVVSVLALGIRDAQSGVLNIEKLMTNFMAGFFLVFSGFKLLDIKGFAEGYSTYDLLASKVYSYGYVYPFIELGLGLFYLTGNTSIFLNLTTLLVMLFSGLGVVIALLKKRKFQCVCLGTIIKVPLTQVTLIEDFGMALMALFMLILR